MALTKCPECGSQVSSAAVSCPKCADPITAQTIEQTGQGLKAQRLAAGALIILSLSMMLLDGFTELRLQPLALFGFYTGIVWHLFVRMLIWWRHA